MKRKLLVGALFLVFYQTVAHASRVASLCAMKQSAKNILYAFGDTQGYKKAFSMGFATKENKRGKNGKAMYPNQDRAVFGYLRKKAFFGVFDGHGCTGDLVAEHVQKTLVSRVLLSHKPAQSLADAFAETQHILVQNLDAQRAGTTAVVAVLEDDEKLTIAHVGDSKCVVVRNGLVVHVTQDHKPTCDSEAARIEKQGGCLVNNRAYDPKTGLSYALSRSLGDCCAQTSVLSAQPEIAQALPVAQGDSIVLASDGVWDVLTPQEVALLAYQEKNAQTLADLLVSQATDLGSVDDITALVIKL